MNPQKFLPYFEKMESLLGRLPSGLQKPILRELTPLKELFLLQRPARIALVGERALSADQVAAFLFGEPVGGRIDGEAPGGWMEYSLPHRGRLHLLDARRHDGAAADLMRAGLKARAPDVVLFVRSSGQIEGELAAAMGHALEIQPSWMSPAGASPRVLGMQIAGDFPAEDARMDLHASLLTKPALAPLVATTVIADLSAPDGRRALALALNEHLPFCAQLETARLTGEREAQKRIALTLVRSNTAICTALGAQPIPLADLPFLTALQSAMVAGIVYVSGRPLGPRTVAEFLGALGVNFGAGVVLRETSRVLLRFLPGWGNAVSGFIAGTGTWAVGRAAIGYFIEGAGIGQARKLVRLGSRPPANPANPALPAPGNDDASRK